MASRSVWDLLVWFGADGRFHCASDASQPERTDAAGLFRAFVNQGPKLVAGVAGATILLGLIRGIAGGVLDRLSSPYGLTWIAAFIVGSSLLFLGLRILTPAGRRLAEMPPGPEFEAALVGVKRLTITELAGFMVILALMIAMRFGY
jgi:hypothetical protein